MTNSTTASAARASTSNGFLELLFAERQDTECVARFQPGPGFLRLPLRFDIERLREALAEVQRIAAYQGEGLHAISLTRRPGDDTSTGGQNNLSGLYWIRPDDSYQEVQREGAVGERGFSEFVPAYAHTYLKTVHDELSKHMALCRMRILKKPPFHANSYHRDPEARIRIPVITNPAAVMVIGNHCTHMPADGFAYFTDTRGYHTAVNGGEQDRVHIVAALPDTSII